MDRSHLKAAAALFDSPVAFVDVETTGFTGRSANGVEQLHIVDAWQHLATIDADDGCDFALERAQRRERAAFDLDVYRIILRYLSRARRPQIVSPLTLTLSPASGGEGAEGG